MANERLTQWSIILKTFQAELNEQLNTVFKANEKGKEANDE